MAAEKPETPSRKGQGGACPSDVDCMLAFKPGFDSRFTFGAMFGCSTLLGLVVLTVALFAAPQLAPGGSSLTSGSSPRKLQAGSCEGYWPAPEVCLPLGSGPRLYAAGEASESKLCPQRSAVPAGAWPGKTDFLATLRAIEDVAREAQPPGALSAEQRAACNLDKAPFVIMMRLRGMSWSRMLEGQIVGSAEFQELERGGVCWPDGFSEHYVDKLNVRPSEEFQGYVKEFDLEGFRKAVACVAALKAAD